MKVLISPMQNNMVVDIATKAFEVAPPLFWVDAPDDVRPGMHKYVDGIFVEIPQVLAPTQPLTETPLQFFNRFIDAEQLAIVTATMRDPVVKLWYDKLLAAQEVVFADPRLSTGLDNLVAAGLLTAERKSEILPQTTSGVVVL